MESSDPGDVSEQTGSGSDFSRKETSSAGTGRTAGSTTSLGPESGSECSKNARLVNRRCSSSYCFKIKIYILPTLQVRRQKNHSLRRKVLVGRNSSKNPTCQTENCGARTSGDFDEDGEL